jgi:hypothetical protein
MIIVVNFKQSEIYSNKPFFKELGFRPLQMLIFFNTIKRICAKIK